MSHIGIWRKPADSALWHAVRMRYPVVPGTWLTETGACSCGDPACLRPGAHPLSVPWWLHASRNADVVRAWWARRPKASIVVPTGREFDVVDIPAAPGREALFRLDLMGYRLGPVAQTGDGRVWVFVQVGARLLHALTHGAQWRYGTFDVHCHSEGSYVALPPSPGVRLARPTRPRAPRPARSRRDHRHHRPHLRPTRPTRTRLAAPPARAGPPPPHRDSPPCPRARQPGGEEAPARCPLHQRAGATHRRQDRG